MECIIISALGPELDPSNPRYKNMWDAIVNNTMINNLVDTTSVKKGVINNLVDTTSVK
jgi:hypothetical protein